MRQQAIGKCYYLGKIYPLYIEIDKSAKKSTIQLQTEKFICTTPTEEPSDLKEALKSFYTKRARKHIGERLKFYQPNFKVKYKAMKIENDDSKWGSCNSKRELTFHWKLMLLPEYVIDYVVVHELCHLVHMNHDRSFWRLVGKVCPDYKEAMAVLGTQKNRRE